MRRIAFFGAVAAVLFGAAVALAAASPSPSASVTPKPSASAHASATPKPSASAKPSASPTPKPSATPSSSPAEPTFNARVQPLQISGMAKVVEATNGTGTVTLHVTGLLDSTLWSVDIDGGTIARPNENVEVAFKTGVDITPLAMDTVQVHLTKPEMARFTHAEGHGGVVAVVSDGTREGYAEFSGAEAG